ncbi:MAG: L-asparaginase/GlutRNAGln amidotransferase subunit [Glaciihabitans sp.]|nr:L-asparaginase/GlutRNAGln amidotransferase subunit [Glaciihabitans sp.]
MGRWMPGIEVVPVDFRLLPSPSLGVDDLLALNEHIAQLGDDIAGIVVSQGTDTLEDTAFVLDVLGAANRFPVVVTGAMRDRSAAGADGMANLVAATQIAADPGSKGRGVLVLFADTIHAARWVRKNSTFRVDAFTSDPSGPVGYVAEGSAHFTVSASAGATLPAPRRGIVPPVASISAGIDDELQLLNELEWLGYTGVILEGMGGGHVAPDAMVNIRTALKVMPVVMASRTGAGPVLSASYGYPGGDIELAAAGVISAGTLSASKARLLLVLLTMADLRGISIAESFRRFAN